MLKNTSLWYVPLIVAMVLGGTLALAAVGGTPAVVALPAVLTATTGLVVALARISSRP